MLGYIYKITCRVNNKVYIGQSKQDIKIRFNRHLYDALDRPHPLNTKFARAIRKYGRDAFYIELIETVDGTVEQLTSREYYYINLYNSVETGYNSTDARCRSGGNTYFGKTEAEMQVIKTKIAATKLGSKNPNAVGIKCKNVNTGEILHFGSMQEAANCLGLSSHHAISTRCLKETNKLLLDKYLCAYETEDFITDYYVGNKFGKNKYSAIWVEDLATGERLFFESYCFAERYFGWYRGTINKYLSRGQYKQYKLILD